MTLTSTAFTNNGVIPKKYSCQGEQVSPPLHITGISTDCKSLAIILHDPDAPMKGGFTHWVVWNIDPTNNIQENFKGGVEGLNSAQKHGYIGMCPPSGTHHYHFFVYALNTKLNLDNSTGKDGLEKAMEGHITGKCDLTGLYSKE